MCLAEFGKNTKKNVSPEHLMRLNLSNTKGPIMCSLSNQKSVLPRCLWREFPSGIFSPSLWRTSFSNSSCAGWLATNSLTLTLKWFYFTFSSERFPLAEISRLYISFIYYCLLVSTVLPHFLKRSEKSFYLGWGGRSNVIFFSFLSPASFNF